MPEIIPNWHPVFVHFTVALLSLAVGLFAISHFLHTALKAQWTLVARWSLWFGMGFTLLTVASGIYAYNTVDHDTPSHIAMTDHRNWALITSFTFLLLSMWSLTWAKQSTRLGTLFVLGMLLAGGLLASTAWRGGELVYRHGLGVMALPQSGAAGHAHVHSENHDHGHGESPVSEASESHDHEAGEAHVHEHVEHAAAESPQPADTAAVEAKPPQAEEMNMDFSGMEEGMSGEVSPAGHDHHDHQH